MKISIVLSIASSDQGLAKTSLRGNAIAGGAGALDFPVSAPA